MTESAFALNQLMDLAARRGQRLGSSTDPATWYFPANRAKAPTVLMIHGFRGDHHGLMAIAAGLPDFNVVIPDLPGYGKSTPLDGEHSVDNYSDWLIQLYARIKSEFGATHVVAHSFGTQVLAGALERGLKPKSVTMLNPISEPASKSKSLAKRATTSLYLLASGLGTLGSALIRCWPAVQVMSSALALTKDKRLRREIHKQHHRYFSNYAQDRVVIEGFRSANSFQVSESAIPSGSLLVVGEKDLVAPLEGQLRLVAGRDDLKLMVLEQAGHLIHYEHPLEVARMIREHVSNSPNRRRKLVTS